MMKSLSLVVLLVPGMIVASQGPSQGGQGSNAGSPARGEHIVDARSIEQFYRIDAEINGSNFDTLTPELKVIAVNLRLRGITLARNLLVVRDKTAPILRLFAFIVHHGANLNAHELGLLNHAVNEQMNEIYRAGRGGAIARAEEIIAAQAAAANQAAQPQRDPNASGAQVQPQVPAAGAQAQPDPNPAGAQVQLQVPAAGAQVQPDPNPAGAQVQPQVPAAGAQAQPNPNPAGNQAGQTPGQQQSNQQNSGGKSSIWFTPRNALFALVGGGIGYALYYFGKQKYAEYQQRQATGNTNA